LDHDQRARTQKLYTKIPIAYGVETVTRNSLKAERPRQRFAINRKRRARECRRSERHHVHTTTHFADAFAISRQHLEVSETPVGQQYRLCSLQVCVSGNDDVAISFSKIEE
jgi:hypothetical protein